MPYLLLALPTIPFSPNKGTKLTPYSHLPYFGEGLRVGLS